MPAELLVGHQSDHQFVADVSASEYQTFTRYSQRELHAQMPRRLTIFIFLLQRSFFSCMCLSNCSSQFSLKVQIFLHLKSRSKLITKLLIVRVCIFTISLIYFSCYNIINSPPDIFLYTFRDRSTDH